jgi:hypothetical protein
VDQQNTTNYSFGFTVDTAPGSGDRLSINFAVGLYDTYPMTDDLALAVLSGLKNLPWPAGSVVNGSVGKTSVAQTTLVATTGENPPVFE